MRTAIETLTAGAFSAALVLSLLACHSLSGGRLYPDAGSDSDSDSDADSDADGHTGGALLAGVHHTVLDYLEGDEPGIVWLPLPMDHATQVPLYVELTTNSETEAIVAGVEYLVDAFGNFGALIELTQDGSLEDAALHWDAIVLTRDVNAEERPVYYAATVDPSTWNQPTALADSSHDDIAALAVGLTAGAISELDEMKAIISWTSENIEYPTDWSAVDSLDATTTLELGQSSSTGFANLATALGRAAGLPTRTVADLYVDASQRTHFMNQFYLGEDLGWRRVEPQAAVELVPEEYALTLRVVTPNDEGDAALSTELWVFPGTPLYCQAQPLQGAERMVPKNPEHFDDCASCDNRAELLATLSAPTDQMTLVFERARELWQRDLLDYQEGGLDEAIMEARRAALDAEDLSDVAAILAAID